MISARKRKEGWLVLNIFCLKQVVEHKHKRARLTHFGFCECMIFGLNIASVEEVYLQHIHNNEEMIEMQGT